MYNEDNKLEEDSQKLENKEKYDIRGFLKRENIDEDLYSKLRDDGLSHHEAMRTVNK